MIRHKVRHKSRRICPQRLMDGFAKALWRTLADPLLRRSEALASQRRASFAEKLELSGRNLAEVRLRRRTDQPLAEKICGGRRRTNEALC